MREPGKGNGGSEDDTESATLFSGPRCCMGIPPCKGTEFLTRVGVLKVWDMGIEGWMKPGGFL